MGHQKRSSNLYLISPTHGVAANPDDEPLAKHADEEQEVREHVDAEPLSEGHDGNQYEEPTALAPLAASFKTSTWLLVPSLFLLQEVLQRLEFAFSLVVLDPRFVQQEGQSEIHDKT